MRWIFVFTMLISFSGFSQYKDYRIAENGDTLNRLDMNDRKQGPWVLHHDKVRGEPGFEEEGEFVNNRKEGEWRLYNLMGDLIGIENYRWGYKDGICQYFSTNGALRAEQSWKALNPDKEYDTLEVEDVDKLDSYHTVVVKNEGAALKHGTWKYYDPETGMILKTETFTLGKLSSNTKTEPLVESSKKKAIPKPKEVLEFEKKNSGKKKVRYQDGSTGGN